MPSMRSCLFGDGVTEIEVPGQTRTSPPLGMRSTAVSEPAVTDEPAARLLAEIIEPPEPPATGTTVGEAADKLSDGRATVGGWNSDGFLPAVKSPGGLRRTIMRLPAPSQV